MNPIVDWLINVGLILALTAAIAALIGLIAAIGIPIATLLRALWGRK